MSRAYSVGIDTPSFSDLRTFSLCPRLWYEQNITKEYVQPEEDYFTYGSLVDMLLTEPENVPKKFVKVVRRSKDQTGMETVGKINVLKEEIATLETALAEKANKIKEKSLKNKKKDLKELSIQLKAIRSNEKKTQVTASVWDNAHETAEAIKENPLWKNMIAPRIEEGCGTFQLALIAEEIGLKGTLDVFLGPKALVTALKLFASGNCKLEEVLKVAVDTDPKELASVTIVDIKTCYMLKKFDPRSYAAQLAIYRAIIEELTGIKAHAFILAGDKDSDLKMAQHYQFTPETLDEAISRALDVKEWFDQSFKAWEEDANVSKAFPAAKTLDGKEQECMRCSVCRHEPFSRNTEPVIL